MLFENADDLKCFWAYLSCVQGVVLDLLNRLVVKIYWFALKEFTKAFKHDSGHEKFKYESSREKMLLTVYASTLALLFMICPIKRCGKKTT